jgi:creatinine amidohydrolase
MTTVRMEEMTSPDIKRAIEAGFTTVVVGVGSTEQHGPHLPTMTDARIGDEVAHRVALRLGDALQARTIDVGISEHHLAFAGTLSFTPETLRSILHDYVDSLVRQGFRRIVFLPTHGGNFATVERAVEEGRTSHPGVEITGCTDLFAFTDFLNSLSAEYGVSAEASGAHAGENETSMMMALEGPLVASERFAPGYLGPTGEAELKVILEKGMPALTSNGVLGDPRTASAAKGEVYVERLAAFLAAELERKTASRA